MKKMKWIKKGISALLALNMVLSSVPLPVFAVTEDNLCEHHPVHTAECHYAEAVAGSPCTHEHSEDCYAILACLHTCGDECASGCTHECTVDNGCITMDLDCHHTHGDCGYSEGTAEVPCGHVHNESCGYVEAVAGTPCANAETDPECDHTGDCGFMAAVEGQPCGHTEHTDCGYAPASEGTPCTHTHAVKVDSADSCYKLLCSHKDGGHDADCGYVAAVEAHECHYECAECVEALTADETTAPSTEATTEPSIEATEPAPVCDCGTDDAAIHATTCAVYVAPENPVCYCTEKCTEVNEWCDVCGFDISKCGGEDTAVIYEDSCDHSSGYDNGFCTACGSYQPAEQNSDGYYEIGNAGQLYWFAEQVNGGETSINAVLMNDIVINAQVLDADGNLISDTSGLRQWTPIGHYNSDTDNLGFAGTFDGNGKTISGLYHYGDSARYAGLFGYSTGTIRDLTIADAYIHTTHSDGRAGAIAGLNEGTVEGCHNSGFVSGNAQIGGIVGRMTSGSINNCTNSSTVNGNDYVGGICGYEAAGTILNCTNSGTITGNNNVGGIVGWNNGTVEKCTNSGTITGNNYVGGIAGCVSDGTINHCYNLGSVEANSDVGGVAGWVQRTSNISNCFSAGTVAGTSRAGGVVGAVIDNESTNATITNCYHDNTVCGYGPVGKNGGSFGSATLTSVEGKTTEQFASGEITWLLNGESAEGVWKQTLGTDAYPSFSGAVVYHGLCGCGPWYSNDAEPNIGDDFYCTNTLLSGGICGAYASAEQNAEGYYEIYNASQLYWFAEKVNGGEKSINAILMNDIDLTNHIWTTICSTGLYNKATTYDDPGYQGIFNGNGHVIKNFTVQGISGTNCTAGLFGTLSGTVKNLGVDNMTFDLNGATDVRAAGIAGQMLDGSLIEDCYVVNSTLAPNSYIVGGIAACNYAGTIKDCFTKNVTIQANARCGNLVSDTRGDISTTDRPGTVTNCWTDADRVVGTQSVASYITDCHANAADSLTSGETAYALGGAFGQTLTGENADEHPVLGGAEVYYGYVSCADDAEMIYTNNSSASATKPAHSTTAAGDKAATCAAKAYCSVCKSEYGEVDKTNHDSSVAFDEDGFCPNGCYEPAGGSGTAEDPYTISNAGQLYWFAQYVDANTQIAGADTPDDDTDDVYSSSANAKLTDNIVVNPGTFDKNGNYTPVNGETVREWTPIGYSNSSEDRVYYTGTFDGNNKTVSGLYFNNSAIGYVGLFGYVGGNGVVKNVGVINSYLSGNRGVGGVAGANRGTVENCYNTGTVTGTGYYVGGVVGYNGDTVTNCYNTGTVTGTGTVSTSVGGVVGYANTGTTVKNCYNTGAVTGTVTGTNTFVGGVVGHAYPDTTVENCYNTGDVSGIGTGSKYVGGVVGKNDGTVRNCYNTGTVTDSSGYIGGVVGYTSGTVANCYFLQTSEINAGLPGIGYVNGSGGTSSNVGAEPKTAEAFASGEVAYLLQGEQETQVWGQTIGTDDFPVLGGAKVYQVTNCKEEFDYSNTNENIGHSWENGTCTVCGKYEEAVQNADGYYEIGNLGQLMWFAQNVNTAHKALLTADITIDNSVVWTPIGLQDGIDNSSIFNGGGHTITFANTNEGSTFGLFSKYNYSIIENLYLAGSITCNTEDNVGVLVNSAYRTTIRNVISTCDITNSATSGGVGGLAGQFGGQDSGGLYSLIENCAVYSDVSGGGNAGGLIGNMWGGNQYCTVRNCAYMGNVAGSVNSGAIVGYNGNNSSTTSTFSNVYFCETDGIGWIGSAGSGLTSLTNVEAKTADQFASGEVAWLLNGSTDQGELVWYQNIGMDAYPKFEGLVVSYDGTDYQNGNTVKVTITWTEMSFTYTGGEWDPETHTYTGSWTADDGAAQITVKNVGAANVPVTFTFQGTMGEVSGSFTVDKAVLAPSRTVATTLTVSGDPQQSGFVDAQIGTVTVSLGSSGWAVGDKVTFYAEGDTDWACAVSEESTENKLVLRSETYFVVNRWVGDSTRVENFVRDYVTAKGARLPAATSYVFTDSFIHNTLMAALTPATGSDDDAIVNFTIANNKYPFYYRHVNSNERFYGLDSNVDPHDVYYFLMWDFPAVN